LGCTNCTLEPDAIEKLCPLMIAFSLDCVTTVDVELGELTLACPATTDGPVGTPAARA
jgi:hypothetical protein